VRAHWQVPVGWFKFSGVETWHTPHLSLAYRVLCVIIKLARSGFGPFDVNKLNLTRRGASAPAVPVTPPQISKFWWFVASGLCYSESGLFAHHRYVLR